jgi:hypothetical protein
MRLNRKTRRSPSKQRKLREIRLRNIMRFPRHRQRHHLDWTLCMTTTEIVAYHFGRVISDTPLDEIDRLV